MPTSRFATLAVALFAVAATWMTPSALRAGEESETLQKAVGLFDDGDYLAAQELFATLDRSLLDADEQALRDEYVSRTQVALTLGEKALRDLEDAETAIKSGESGRARPLLEAVLNNEYAAQPVRKAALAHLRFVDQETPKQQQAAPAARGDANALTESEDSESTRHMAADPAPGAPPRDSGGDVDRARAGTTEGDELAQAGRLDEAVQRYNAALAAVPGFPEAVDGLARVEQLRSAMGGRQAESLSDRIRRRDAINWQRVVSQYRDQERAIRADVLAENFDQANQAMIRAQQLVDSGKQFADPATKYDNLRSELDALVSHVRNEERAYHEREVAKARREIEEQRSARLRRIEENRAIQVEALMQQALQHRKDGELDAAINVLRQVSVIDPKHSPARWLMDILEDQRQFRQARTTREQFYSQSLGALEDVEKAKIPWYDEIKYPDNWLELIGGPERQKSSQSRRDRLLLGALDRPIRVDFQRSPFDQVIERLADRHRINVIVNWHDLNQAGIDRSTPVELDLPNEITLKKALTELLEQAGGGLVDVGYEVSDGVLTVATQGFLNKKTHPRVYDVKDLLMEIPDFTDAPRMDLRDTTRRLPPVSQSSSLPWKFGDDDDDEAEHDPERMTRLRQLIDLIQGTVDPDSWRDHGGAIGAIKEINGQLVITQNTAAHRKISGLLDKLREERAIQISVEALFITVSSHYLEELGMDLDIILNNGNAGFDFATDGAQRLIDPVLGSNLLLPRTFSRLGFTPDVPALGVALLNTGIVQPFGNAAFLPQGRGGGGSLFTPVPIASGVTQFTNPSRLPSDIPGSYGGQDIAPALQVLGSFLDNIQVDFLIRATQADSRSSILTAPRLVVFNGASAWVAVTIQQNFISQLQPIVGQNAAAQQPITQTIDAGASLFVRATVTADRRYVMMLLAPGLTRLIALQQFAFSGGTGAGAAFIQLPTLSAQRIQTVVSVPDGGTLLIGGQKLASETEVEAGVPLLSKIPILKRMYSARSMIKDEQTLLILIKPKILIQSEQEEIAFPSFNRS